MSKAIQCDNNCGNVIGADDADARLWWIKIGWHDAGERDVCSVNCAREYLAWMIDQSAENIGGPHAFHDGSDGDLECSECGSGPTAPWHALETVDA